MMRVRIAKPSFHGKVDPMAGNSQTSYPTLHIFSQPAPNTSKGTVKRKKGGVNI